MLRSHAAPPARVLLLSSSRRSPVRVPPPSFFAPTRPGPSATPSLRPPPCGAAARPECQPSFFAPAQPGPSASLLSFRPGAARVPPPPSFSAPEQCRSPARVLPSLSSPRRGPVRVHPPPFSSSWSGAVAGPSNPLSSLWSSVAARAGKEKFADSKGFAIFAHNSLKSVYDYGKFERPEEGD